MSATKVEVAFSTFAAAVNTRYTQMQQHELYVVDKSDEIYQRYLAAFPEGSNPIFRERTEHDCNTCKQFIRRLGSVIAIVDGKPMTVWDIAPIGDPYDTVAAALSEFVLSQPVVSVFRSKESRYGNPKTFELDESNNIRYTWHHLWGDVAKRHKTMTVEKDLGEINSIVAVFKRGLTELTPDSLATIAELIEGNALYRGEEHKRAVVGFQKLQRQYYRLTDEQSRDYFIWVNLMDPASRFRNTVIGTLAIDISEGKDLEAAVKMFESKVAPTNYKRPTAIITQRMVEDAMNTVRSMNLEQSLMRRHANPSDIRANNVLYADFAVRPKMKDGIEAMLMQAAAPSTVNLDKSEEISIDDFLTKLLPQTTSLELLLESSMLSNFMSLTAPQGPSEGKLFRWGNDFAWSYDGDVADSMLRQEVAARGGRVTGAFRFSHMWNYAERNASLMDLHVFMPGSTIDVKSGINNNYGYGRRVGWNHRGDSMSGGTQDVDYTAEAPEGYVPVENIAFPELSKMPEGRYICKIHNWQHRLPTYGGFKAEIEFGNELYTYERKEPMKHHEWVTVAVVTLKNGRFSIEHHMTPGLTSREKWGLKTGTLTKVNMVMLSPNHWDDKAVGNRHHFFILDGCNNPEPTRGIYNEFLSPALEKHRRVFELLGSKTKCAPTADQLSGVGFSSTRTATVKVMVQTKTCRRPYAIKF
jgi:hypothetical protein